MTVAKRLWRAGLSLALLLALAFPLLPLAVSFALHRFRFRPERPDPIKNATYECGVEAEGTSWGQFNARYYVFALLFLLFPSLQDIEALGVPYHYLYGLGNLGLA
jgi:NADH:ubiquinone oxidoreductase subunit 3 (subunit A)